MSIGAYNNDEPAQTTQPRVFSLRVSYTTELAAQLDTALQFVVRKIGFKPSEQFTYSIPSENNLILDDTNGNRLIINCQKLESNDRIKSIIFYTDDCLRDYHKYILLGVEFTSRPEYNGSGLQVNFLDHAGNCCTLLEERIYTET